MKCKEILIGVVIILVFAVTGCGSRHINTVKSSNLETMDDITLIQISDNLYYDEETLIVFIWNGKSSSASNTSTMPTAYPAPNGLPYKYDPVTNSLVEIDPIKEWGLDVLLGKIETE